jgi:DNA polymerase-3 subunit gamma/tau
LDPLAIAPQTPVAGASLTVETPRPTTKAAPAPQPSPKPAAAPMPAYAPPPAPVHTAPTPLARAADHVPERKASLLDQLRSKQQQHGPAKVEVIRRPLNNEEVLGQWNSLLEIIRGQNKPSTVTSMQMARLSVEGDTLVITCDTSLNKRFLESEMTDWLTDLKTRFANTDIAIRIDVAEGPVEDKAIDPKYLSSHERFKLMAEHYPMLKELKDKLKLEIKY